MARCRDAGHSAEREAKGIRVCDARSRDDSENRNEEPDAILPPPHERAQKETQRPLKQRVKPSVVQSRLATTPPAQYDTELPLHVSVPFVG